MGSEMCIRDRILAERVFWVVDEDIGVNPDTDISLSYKNHLRSGSEVPAGPHQNIKTLENS